MFALHMLFPLLFIVGMFYIFGIYKIAKALGFVDNFFTFFFSIGSDPNLKKLTTDLMSFKNIPVPEHGQYWLKYTKVSLIIYLSIFLLWIFSFLMSSLNK